MKYIKKYEMYKNAIYDEFFSDITVSHTNDLILNQKYPFYRTTSFKRLKSISDFPFFKEFLDEILLNKYIKVGSLGFGISMIIKAYDFGSTYIRVHDKDNVINQISDMERFRLYYEEYPKIGSIEKEAINFLNIKKAVNKYNI